jgi:hypothetical protein
MRGDMEGMRRPNQQRLAAAANLVTVKFAQRPRRQAELVHRHRQQGSTLSRRGVKTVRVSATATSPHLKGPRLGDAAFRAQRGVGELPNMAKKLSMQAHGEC